MDRDESCLRCSTCETQVPAHPAIDGVCRYDALLRQHIWATRYCLQRACHNSIRQHVVPGRPAGYSLGWRASQGLPVCQRRSQS